MPIQQKLPPPVLLFIAASAKESKLKYNYLAAFLNCLFALQRIGLQHSRSASLVLDFRDGGD